LIALRELGYQIDLLCFPHGVDIEIPGVRIFRCKNPFGVQKIPIGLSWRKSLLDFSLLLEAFSLAKKEKYLLFHGIEEGAIIARLLSKTHKIPWIMDMHSSMADQIRDMNFLGSKVLSRVIHCIEKNCLKSASGVMTVSDDLTSRANSYRQTKTAYTLFDLPLPLPTPSDSQISELRTSLGITPNDKVLLYTGNLKQYQGVELLLRGFSNFLKTYADKHQPVKLVIVGGGPEEEQERAFYKNLISELNIANLTNLAGLRPSDQMGAFYSLADILVSPRLSGTNTPLKIYSYLEAQKPILATRIVSHTQVLTEQSAFLFELDPEDFAEVLSNLLLNPELQQEKVKHGLALINNQFSREVFLERLGKLYHSAIDAALRLN